MKSWLPVLVLLLLGPAAAQAADKPENCGTIITTPDEDITSFSPLYSDSIANAQAAQLLFADLIWVNRFAQIDYGRSLVTKIDVSPDTKTYTVTLKPWAWSDGVPVSTQDVLYDWKLIQEMGDTYPGYGSGGIPMNIQSVTALDAMHFKVVLKQPANPTWFIYNGLSQLAPLPYHAWKHFTLDELFAQQSEPSLYSVVDGPLKIQRLDPGLDAIFVPNPHYSGPKMHFSRFVFKFVENDGARMQQVESGDLDFAPLRTELYDVVQHVKGVYVQELAPPSTFDELSINLLNPKDAFFRDVRVREAMQDAINQKGEIETVLHGFGFPVYTAVPPSDANMLAPALRAGHYPVGYGPAKARALLREAGYAPGPDGIMQKDGRKLEFVDLDTPGGAEAAEMTLYVQANLRAVGIQMDVREVEFNQAMTIMQFRPKDWDVVFLGRSDGGYPSGEGLLETGAYNNNTGYSDPKMDRLIEDSVSKPGLDALYQFEIYTAEQQPMIFLPRGADLYLVRDRIHGVDNFTDPAGLLAPEQLYCTAVPK